VERHAPSTDVKVAGKPDSTFGSVNAEAGLTILPPPILYDHQQKLPNALLSTSGEIVV
jgi:hypothetical protein